MEKEYIVFTVGRNKIRKIYLNEIIYIKASGSYSKIYLEFDVITISKILKEVDQFIKNELFIRINRSCIINLYYCSEIKSGNSAFLVMKNGDKIKVSKNKIDVLINRFCDSKNHLL